MAKTRREFPFEFKREAVPLHPSPTDRASGIARLKRGLDRTRMERDVLKKAIGLFAQVPR